MKISSFSPYIANKTVRNVGFSANKPLDTSYHPPKDISKSNIIFDPLIEKWKEKKVLKKVGSKVAPHQKFIVNNTLRVAGVYGTCEGISHVTHDIHLALPAAFILFGLIVVIPALTK